VELENVGEELDKFISRREEEWGRSKRYPSIGLVVPLHWHLV
jgi:hypothetical protein